MKSYKEFSEEYYQLDEKFRLRNPFGGRKPKIKGGDALDVPKDKKKTPIRDFAGAVAGGLGWGTAAEIGSNLVGTAKDLVGKALKTDEPENSKISKSERLKSVEKHT
jgi:hypothetical protein